MSADWGDKSERVTSYSEWMSQLPAELHNTPLFDLAIPGSHDSMSYDLDTSSSIVGPDKLKRFSSFFCARRVLQRWASTQEENIMKQLDAGVRYFDLRIARKQTDTEPTKFYFHHGLYTRTDVETVFRMIDDWAEMHPTEILILALSQFKDMEDQLHVHLIDLIKTTFGDKLFHRSDTPTLRSCWDKGRNIIVSYDYPAHHHHHPEMWYKIPYYYANSMDPVRVELELCQVLDKARPPHNFFVCGLNLTLPEDTSVFCYVLWPSDNFTNLVRRSLPELLQWVKQQTGRRANIIASDVVTRDNFVPTVVQLNISRDCQKQH